MRKNVSAPTVGIALKSRQFGRHGMVKIILRGSCA